MSVLSAQSIRARCLNCHAPIITPFNERREVFYFDGRWLEANVNTLAIQQEITGKRPKTFSYGLSSASYDIRLAQGMWLFPFFGRLGSSIEYFNVPSDIVGRILNKSSWARRFIDASKTTNMEPGWRGYLTIELTSNRFWPIYIRAGTPIAQVQFDELDKPTEQPYNGKYQNQESGPQSAR